MRPLTIVIIGASFAGVASALAIKQMEPATTVTVIDRQETVGFIPSSINRVLKGSGQNLTENASVKREELEAAGIELKLGCEVVSVEPADKIIRCRQTSQVSDLSYDKLILAMGSRQNSDKILGTDLPGVLTTKTLLDSQESQSELDSAASLLIIGGGQVGLEAADAFVSAGKQVTIVEAFDSLLFKYFDSEMVVELEERMLAQGVQIHKNQQVETIATSQEGEDLLCIRTTLALEMTADRVLLAVNFRPNSQLVAHHLACDVDRTLVVDKYLQTSEADIYATGDLIRVPYAGTASDYYLPFVNTAVITGRLAAMNALGHRESLQPLVRVTGSQLFGLFIASAGLTEEEAKLYHRTLTLKKTQLDEQQRPMTLKLIIEEESGCLLGGQVYSQANVLWLMDVLAIAIKSKMTDRDLAFQDYLYNSLSSAKIPILNNLAFALYQKRLKEVRHNAP